MHFTSSLRLPILAMTLAMATSAFAASNWAVVPSANPESQNILQSVSAISPSDMWAVGYGFNSSYDQFTVAEHWDGSTWAAFPTPSPGGTQCSSLWQNTLNGVAAVSTDDVWAVGFICGSGEDGVTLIEHWDGSSWTVVSNPNPSEYSYLYAVAAVSDDDVWAVGQNYGTAEPSTLIEHWNGTAWGVVPSPNPSGRTAYLDAISAVSANNIWAVGYSGKSSDPYTIPLVEHYDGTSWQIVPCPFNHNSPYNQLNGVMALSASDAWAVGYQNANANGQDGQALFEHWDGHAWSLTNSPVAGNVTYMYSAAGTSASNIWAFGYFWQGDLESIVPGMEHWDGKSWTVVRSPDPGAAAEYFGSVAVQGQIWAVGEFSSTAGDGGWPEDPQTFTAVNQ